MRFAAFRPKGKFYPYALIVTALSLSASTSGRAQDTRAVALSKYATLTTRVNAGDLSVDWREFRIAAAGAGMEQGFDWHPVRQRVLKDLDVGNLQLALSGAQTVIAHNMANPEGHLLAMTVYQQMSMQQAADRERGIVDAIVKSIMGSGDGMSAQHAWSTVSSSEEEFVVNMVLDADTESQDVVRKDGLAYDRRTIRGEDGAERVLWFRAGPEERTVVATVQLPSR